MYRLTISNDGTSCRGDLELCVWTDTEIKRHRLHLPSLIMRSVQASSTRLMSMLMIQDMLTSSAANFSTAVKGVFSGTLKL